MAATGMLLTGLNGSETPAAPPANPTPQGAVTIYDVDPQHLWNRLHRALWVRVGRDGKEYGFDRLDPLLWAKTKYLLEGKLHEQAIAVLDEFLAARGEKLVDDPLKRAILQRDLWAVFDWTTEAGENTQDAYIRRPSLPRRSLQKRLARTIQRLALTAGQIKSLPDTYAAAVDSKAFAAKYDPGHPDRSFLPPDLFQKDGPWVEIQADNASRVAVPRHAHDFGARSAFRVFLSLPDGRQATTAYLAKLGDVPRPWLLTRNPGSKRDTLSLTPDLPQFPAGTQVALVRQMLLIDRDGQITATRVTESVQFRAFRSIPKRNPDTGRDRESPAEQDFYEFTRNRAQLFAGKTGGLRPLGPNDKDFHTQLQVHTYDEFETADNDLIERLRAPVTQSCLGCHDRPGIYSVRTYTEGGFPISQYRLPDLQENHDAETEARLTAFLKRGQYSWGVLQGLWEDR
ncbi:hypothetical protein FRUB_00383 [Fimbriiglobus ruber]|uniref:Uncharacterized protein n=2 Tax=Fimbriiglobus ruber TaxID=1908690 RepID=A0A225E4J3_9BACT|nr:hypothetical protein FRUB_00383 [Fimbriiglobus ruber]